MLLFQSGLTLFLILILICLHFLNSVDATCYTPNGEEAIGDSPCTSSSDSMCCPGDPGASVCLSNGLCFVPSQNVIARSSCTDPSWSSSACTSVCKDSLRDQFCQLTPCIDTSFCCGLGKNAWGCCDSGSGFHIDQGTPINMQGGGTETETVTAVRTVIQTDTVTDTGTVTAVRTVIQTETETETDTTTIVTRADGGIFTSTKVETITTLTTATAYPAGFSPTPVTTCPAGSTVSAVTGDSSGSSTGSSLSCPNCSSKQVVVGVGVGVPLAAALLCSLILLLWRKNHNRNNQAAVVPPPVVQYQYPPAVEYQPQQQGYAGYTAGAGAGYVSPQVHQSPGAELNARDVSRFELGDQRPPTYISTK